MHCREASRTSVKLDVSGGVAGRAYSSVFIGISIMNRNSVIHRLHVVMATLLKATKVGSVRPNRPQAIEVNRPYQNDS